MLYYAATHRDVSSEEMYVRGCDSHFKLQVPVSAILTFGDRKCFIARVVGTIPGFFPPTGANSL